MCNGGSYSAFFCEGEGGPVSAARAAARGPADGSPGAGATRPRSQTPAAHGTRKSSPGSFPIHLSPPRLLSSHPYNYDTTMI